MRGRVGAAPRLYMRTACSVKTGRDVARNVSTRHVRTVSTRHVCIGLTAAPEGSQSQ